MSGTVAAEERRTQEDREEMLRLFDSGDDYGLLLFVNRRWLDRYHPDALNGCVSANMGEGISGIRVPFKHRLPSSS
jgi:hypothetical protein